MEIVPEAPELVRCATCHELYDHGRAAPPHGPTGCPHCGATAWLSARVPIEQSGGGRSS